MRRAPRTARLGKLPGGALGRFGRADFRDQPPRAHAVVAGRVPAKSRDPRRDFCPKPRPGEKRGPHIDRHLTSRCCRTSSQIVVGHVVNDVRRCGGPIGSKRRQKRRSHFAWFLAVFSARKAAFAAAFFAMRRPTAGAQPGLPLGAWHSSANLSESLALECQPVSPSASKTASVNSLGTAARSPCFCYNGPACCVMPECEGHYR